MNMDSIFGDDEYKYEYVGSITFETPECIIANGNCPVTSTNRRVGDQVEYVILDHLRIKEPWDCYIKINPEDREGNELLDIILINQKLFNSLEETTLFEKLDYLYWDWELNVVVKGTYNLNIFDLKYFNNLGAYQIPKGKNAWYNYFYQKLMSTDREVVEVPHGLTCFVSNDEYDIFIIKDSKNGNILGINVEIVNPEQDDQQSYDYSPKSPENKINSSTVKTLD